MKLFYTGKGDRGESHIGKTKIQKTSPYIKAVGSVDELNSLLGLVKTKSSSPFSTILHNVQEDLFIIQAHIGYAMIGKGEPPELKKEKVTRLEAWIDDFEKQVQPVRGFVISGITEISAWLDYARAVARRTEIAILELQKTFKKGGLHPNIFAYLNRLSSLLYAMARVSAKTSKKRESHPTYT